MQIYGNTVPQVGIMIWICFKVGRGMTYEEDKTHFSMWSMMHSPLLLGNDLTQLDEVTLGIITNEEIIALNQSPFVYQARRMVDFGDTEIWAKPLVSTMSGEIAVAFLNRSASTQSITFNLDSIGIDATEGFTLRDLWTKEDFPKSTNTHLTREVPAHGIVVLQLKGTSLPYNPFQYDKKTND